MADTPTTALASTAETLPVVGYFNSFGNALCKGVPRFSTDIALTPREPAQAIIDQLRAERDKWYQEAAAQAASAIAAHDELAALKAVAPAAGGVVEDAARYQWLADRFLGADVDWNESGKVVLLFEIPPQSRVWGDCSMTIDAARLPQAAQKEGE